MPVPPVFMCTLTSCNKYAEKHLTHGIIALRLVIALYNS